MVIKTLTPVFALASLLAVLGSPAPGPAHAAALRTAQLKLMGEQATSHPPFWAPFVLVGDGGAP